ncbi:MULTISPECIES: replication initiation and membrane attachment family protein [Lactobacillus]|uniref:DnaD domain-containing protein n=1 Tax=Lactobacillus helsingborgensis TaxID=1218494 RepID=A0AA47B5N0_9LACO|nr:MULTISPECIES: hypothetical protein [Lactobacillus]UZX30569.1 hypothetical protein LDX53_09330 [Lactobacillus helsingborgensis]
MNPFYRQRERGIDWKLITYQLSLYNVPPEEVMHKQKQLQMCMESYNLTETDLVEIIVPLLKDDKKINIDLIVNTIARKCRTKKRSNQMKEAIRKSRKSSNNINLSNSEKRLLDKVENTSTSDFLYLLKKRNNKYENLIRLALKHQYKLPDELINILFYDYLKTHKYLRYDIFNKIDDWLDHGVITAKQAIAYSKEVESKKQEINARDVYCRTDKTLESRTDWSKKNNYIYTKDDEAKLKELEEWFKNYEKKYS